MSVETIEVDVAIVGAGPGGLAAAKEVLSTGRTIALIDDGPLAGGQIWRAEGAKPSADAAPWSAALRVHGDRVTLWTETQIVDAQRPAPGARTPPILLAASPDGPRRVVSKALILAPGAMERFLPFPGWTLPGVVGAGGLQALIKGGLDVTGRRVVVAGSGPLLVAVADLARRRGARVVTLAEQATRRALLPFARAVLRRPPKALQGARLGLSLCGVPKRFGAWPVRAEGDGRLERVVLRRGRRGSRIETIDCDLLACGFGLVPRVALPRLLGCEVALGADGTDGALHVVVDDDQRTTVPGTFAVGEVTGVGGVDKALAEGTIAGLVASGFAPTPAHRAARDAERGFAEALSRSFRLREELRELPQDDTLVCRCEDVSWGPLRAEACPDARAAKLSTRCGMGPCQARVCGPALAFLRGWQPEPPRPPLFPVDLATLERLYAERHDPK